MAEPTAPGASPDATDEPGARTRSRRRTFGPVVVIGLAAAGLAAYAGTRSWVRTDGAEPATGAISGLGHSGLATSAQLGEAPLAGALGLVALACWGVVLVTRRWVRRVIAAVGVVASLGIVAVALDAWRGLVDDVRAQIAGSGSHAADVSVSLGPWLLVAGVVGVVSALAFAAAVAWAPDWPEMGARYDAPGAAEQARTRKEPESSLDLWRAIDDGDDPTR